ncbi:Preprotein translocase band 1 subunit [Piscirickettsia salmonis]|uniref:preprotein translocase subunit SecG n=1 Tax=Piscirickettsia salmonis TaxID=1238 RepID=UPI0012B8F663|nr:preprotein translocase subunit SecG [Piscirickettsia salmonis]QGP51817.1 Preprotein translocase band 1 subunit [Piscirickettsia salmonis]QGP52944.1 Preprotein translocase band 1 subunit [Piscirickettsia salmonis]QGP61125.1 Preprotein translocase band 1 subunit [Piscirickettsia salmonis]QGP62516.1 Preprotein translocase band 1 subunit [Piscirickettsia salmonis]
MEQILLILLIVAAVVMIVLILIQQGKGATAGASFGTGASQTVFGSAGAASFLVKATAMCALVFFVICLVLGRMAAQQGQLSPTSATVKTTAAPAAALQEATTPTSASSQPQTTDESGVKR